VRHEEKGTGASYAKFNVLGKGVTERKYLKKGAADKEGTFWMTGVARCRREKSFSQVKI